MELNTSQISAQAAAQASALASLMLLRKTLELQASGAANLLQSAIPASAPSNPPNLGNSIDVMA
jgi:stage V sporulation protein SpoVS